MASQFHFAHLADIHVQDRRRDEYAAVFDQLVRQVEGARPLTAVVIAGDVFDSMTRASANNFLDVAGLLDRLANVAPVVMIPGNHDLNVRAPGTPDLITPMLTGAGGALNLQAPRVTLWRHAGVYRTDFAPEVLWCVGAVDEPLPDLVAVIREARARPTSLIVALFHESLNGCRYPNGQGVTADRFHAAYLATLTAADVPVLAMLGDIHLQQVIKFPGTDMLRAAYPGSLVCQNLGESHLNHGWIEWSVTPATDGIKPSIRVRPHDVPNPVAPVTHEIRAGVDVTLPGPYGIPEHPRIYRVRYDVGTTEEQAEAIAAALAARYGAPPREIVQRVPRPAPVVPADPTPDDPPPAAPDVDVTQPSDPREDVNELELAAAILEGKGTPEDVAADVLAEHQRNMQRMGRAAAGRPRLLRLEFNDLYCYGGNNVLDFAATQRGPPGLVGLVAPNHSGKSSLLDVVALALTAQPLRGRKPSVLRRGAQRFEVAMDFELDGKRGRARHTWAHTGATALELKHGAENLTQRDQHETAQQMARTFGKPAHLTQVTLYRPGYNSDFTQQRPDARRKQLAGLLCLGYYQEIKAEVDKRATALRAELRGLMRALETVLPGVVPPGNVTADRVDALCKHVEDAARDKIELQDQLDEKIARTHELEAQLEAIAHAVDLVGDVPPELPAEIAAQLEKMPPADLDRAAASADGRPAATHQAEVAALRRMLREDFPDAGSDPPRETLAAARRRVEALEDRRRDARARAARLAADLADMEADRDDFPRPGRQSLDRSDTSPPDDESGDPVTAADARRVLAGAPDPGPRPPRPPAGFGGLDPVAVRAAQLAAAKHEQQLRADLLRAERRVEFAADRAARWRAVAALAPGFEPAADAPPEDPGDPPPAPPPRPTQPRPAQTPDQLTAALPPRAELEQILRAPPDADAELADDLAAALTLRRHGCADALVPDCPGCDALRAALRADVPEPQLEQRRDNARRAAQRPGAMKAVQALRVARAHEAWDDFVRKAGCAQAVHRQAAQALHEMAAALADAVEEHRAANDIADAVRQVRDEADWLRRAAAHDAARRAVARALAALDERMECAARAEQAANDAADRITGDLQAARDTLDARREQDRRRDLAQQRQVHRRELEDRIAVAVAAWRCAAAADLQIRRRKTAQLDELSVRRAALEATLAEHAAARAQTSRAWGVARDAAHHLSLAREIPPVVARLARANAYRYLLDPLKGLAPKFIEAAEARFVLACNRHLANADASFRVSLKSGDLRLRRCDAAPAPMSEDPELASSYQAFILELAARASLLELARVPLPRLLMIDEGFGCLDNTNLPRVAGALKGLARSTDCFILAVTHREDFRPHFAQLLGIDVTPRGTSHLEWPPGSTCRILEPPEKPESPDESESVAPISGTCTACRKKVAPTDEAWNRHIRTQTHKAYADPCHRPVGDRSYCQLCAKSVSFGGWLSHVRSASHQRMVE